MISFLSFQFPALQVIMPLFGALFNLFIISPRYSRLISFVIALLSLMMNLMALYFLDGEIRYVFGGFSAPFGIEYRIDALNQPLICFISFLLVYILSFNHNIIDDVKQNKIHIIYSLLLLIYTGIIGILSTNDLFNLYVFLEISSLASYAIISQGRDKRALMGALDYLLIGTIGASFILISIGMIFNITGSLNIDDIYFKLQSLYHSKILVLGFTLFIIGCLLKIALFPLHFWMIRSYSFASPILLSFLSGISSIVGFYILIRFIYFVIDNDILYSNGFGDVIKVFSLSAIVFGSYSAFKVQDLRGTILYSAVAQIGYATILLMLPSPIMVSIAISIIIADSITKIVLFLYVYYAENISEYSFEDVPLTYQDTENDKIYLPNFFFFLILIINLLSNAAIPINMGFVNKINMLSEILSAEEYLIFVILTCISIISLGYNYKIFRILYALDLKVKNIDVVKVFIPTFFSFILMFYSGIILEFFSNFFMSISNG